MFASSVPPYPLYESADAESRQRRRRNLTTSWMECTVICDEEEAYYSHQRGPVKAFQGREHHFSLLEQDRQ
eukprot:768221-Hanusia_phi.AAC.16